jgi:hypothetical protein
MNETLLEKEKNIDHLVLYAGFAIAKNGKETKLYSVDWTDKASISEKQIKESVAKEIRKKHPRPWLISVGLRPISLEKIRNIYESYHEKK